RGVHRILGGKDAEQLEFPWQISLRRELPLVNADGGHTCSGSIISDQYVLTAAHCVSGLFSFPSNYLVMVGDQNINEKDTTEDAILVESVRGRPLSTHVHGHPDWDRDTLRSDYAMLKLQTPLDFGGRHKHLMPICLPEKDDDFEGLNCTASGWGLTKDSESALPSQLRNVDMPIIPYDACKEYYKDIIEIDEDTMVCAGYDQGGKSVCQGDSGGPLQCPRTDGRFVLAGAASFGVTCAGAKQPGVFSRVSTHLDWIRSNAGMDGN
ncbi:unnamed protein product, partial [Ixodes persulcatus]